MRDNKKSPPAATQDSGGFYSLLRHFSIDVVIGATGSCYLASRVLKEDLPWVWYIILGCSVWLIYTLDHLIDGRRMGASAQTARHRLHHRIFWPLAIIWVVVFMGSGITAILILPQRLLISGLIVGGMALAHTFLVLVIGRNVSPGLTKEIGVAIVYSAGIWLPVIQMKDTEIPVWCWLVMAQFFLAACANLLLISLYERKSDEADQQANMARWAGEKITRRLIQLLLSAGLLIGAVVLYLRFTPLTVASVAILTVIFVAHFQVLFFPEFFKPRERYRAYADLAFCFTWLILLL